MATDAWGIDDGWWDVGGTWRPASPETIHAIREAMGDPAAGRPVWVVRPGDDAPLQDRCGLVLEDGTDLGGLDRLPPDLPLGIHDLRPLHGGPVTSLLVGPGRCHLPGPLRTWGVAVQVPSVRSRRSWGIGDLADVRDLARWLATLGAGVLALSPLHAPTPVSPVQPSPYYPSSRRFRSPLLLRVEDVPGADDASIDDLGALGRARGEDRLIDRDRCWALQRAALERIWVVVRERAADEVALACRASRPLEAWARFCALAELHGHAWPQWPPELRHPDSPAVAEAARAIQDRVAFHAWLQLRVDAQLAAAGAAGVTLIQDLAVGADPSGADAWIWQDLLASEFSIGAPPDEFAPAGQRWGLPPFIPWRLRDAGYRPLAELVRAALVPGGGLRIDHVMGLTRLFWVPEGASPAEGAYVRFAGRELLEVVALESARAGALVVGEDLGTVEAGFRDLLAETGILSTRLVWFEDVPPEGYPEQALAMVTTHDLPTVAGVCTGLDAPAAIRGHLEALVGPLDGRGTSEVVEATLARLGRSPAALAITTAEDLLGVVERPNLPGSTGDERPNWSLGLPVPLDDLMTDPGARRALDALRSARSPAAD